MLIPRTTPGWKRAVVIAVCKKCTVRWKGVQGWLQGNAWGGRGRSMCDGACKGARAR